MAVVPPTNRQAFLCLSLIFLLTLGSSLVLGSIWPLFAVISCFGARSLFNRLQARGVVGNWTWGPLSGLSMLLLVLALFVSIPATQGRLPRLGLLGVLTVEAVLISFTSSRGRLQLLAVLGAAHLLILSLERSFVYYPFLVAIGFGLLVLFFSSMAASGFVRRERGRVSRDDSAPSNLPPPTGSSRSRLSMHLVLIGGTLAVGFLLFFVFPRVRIELDVEDADIGIERATARRIKADRELEQAERAPSRRASEVGYTDKVSLSVPGPGEQDSTQIMTVRLQRPDGTPHVLPYVLLRGSTQDTYDRKRKTWFKRPQVNLLRDETDGSDGWIGLPGTGSSQGELIRQEIVMKPVISNVLFAVPTVVRVQAAELSVDVDDGSAQFVSKVHTGSRTDVVLSRWVLPSILRGQEEKGGRIDGRYLRGLGRTGRLVQLTRKVVEGAEGKLERCERIVSYLRQEMSYSLTVDYTDSNRPIEDFLFVRKQGYCIHFASGMIAMLRSLGIPSRMACGFATTETGKAPGEFLIRRRNAHSWVEVHFGDTGWVAFDPSPAQSAIAQQARVSSFDRIRAWLNYVSRFDDLERERLMERFSDSLSRPPFWIVGALLGIVVLWRRYGRKRKGRGVYAKKADSGSTAVGFYDAFLILLSSEGIRKRASSTPRELANAARGVFSSEEVDMVTDLFCATRYGERTLTDEEEVRAQRAVVMMTESQELRSIE